FFCFPRPALFSLFSYCSRAPRDLHSFPTRRSSDLAWAAGIGEGVLVRWPAGCGGDRRARAEQPVECGVLCRIVVSRLRLGRRHRSEEHTSELQSRENLVCRLLLEKKNNNKNTVEWC